MSDSDRDVDRRWADVALDRAIDAALARALPPPCAPAQFHARLQAALARAAQADASLPDARRRLEHEQRERLAELESGYLRVRRRTLGILIGAAFAAGAAVALALPWLRASFGPNAPLVLASAGAAAGLMIGAVAWLLRPGVPAH